MPPLLIVLLRVPGGDFAQIAERGTAGVLSTADPSHPTPGKNDVYCVFHLAQHERREQSLFAPPPLFAPPSCAAVLTIVCAYTSPGTEVVHNGGAEPVWRAGAGEEVSFELPRYEVAAVRSVQLDCMDEDEGKDDDHIGSALLRCSRARTAAFRALRGIVQRNQPNLAAVSRPRSSKTRILLADPGIPGTVPISGYGHGGCE